MGLLDTEIQLNELFWSIQGEGRHAGYSAVFVRLQGCPVGCGFCDSKLTWYAGGERIGVGALAERVAALPSALVIITGGEPLIHDLDPLIAALLPLHRAIHLETSGARPFKGTARPAWLTLSPKAAAGWQVDELVLLSADELKYVVDEDFDPAIVDMHLALRRVAAAPVKLTFDPPVYLMPEGAPPREAMIQRTLAILRERPAWRFGPRLQYAYGAIGDGEGVNNKIVSVAEARSRAREAVAAR